VVITDYVLTPHAEFEMRRRDIGEETIREVVTAYRSSKVSKYWRGEE